MIDRRIEQAVFLGTKCTAHSPGFDDSLIEASQHVIKQYGYLPFGVQALFVVPLGSRVGVWQVEGQRFHVRVVSQKLYRIIHDPFRIVAELSPSGPTDSELPSLNWTTGPTPPRMIQDVQAILKSDESPTLLGAAQALVDGGRVLFPRSSPDAETIRRMWMLLPDSVRGELKMATFAPSNSLRFDLLVTPESHSNFEAYLTEQQAGDYPEGRYEYELQYAAETNDADAIDRLFARRSASQALRFALTLLIGAVVVGIVMRFIPWERLR